MFQALSPRWDRPLSALFAWQRGVSSPGPASSTVGRGGSDPAAFSFSEAADIEGAWARPTPGLGDALALDGGAAAIALMADHIVPVADL